MPYAMSIAPFDPEDPDRMLSLAVKDDWLLAHPFPAREPPSPPVTGDVSQVIPTLFVKE